MHMCRLVLSFHQMGSILTCGTILLVLAVRYLKRQLQLTENYAKEIENGVICLLGSEY